MKNGKSVLDELKVHRQTVITCEMGKAVRAIGEAVISNRERHGKLGEETKMNMRKQFLVFDGLMRRERQNENLNASAPGPGHYHDGIGKFRKSTSKPVLKMVRPHVPRTKQAIYDKYYGVDIRPFLHNYSSIGKQVLSQHRNNWSSASFACCERTKR